MSAIRAGRKLREIFEEGSHCNADGLKRVWMAAIADE